MQPGRYTELFFLDDATALAAGHRPCAECRRDDYRRFLELWPAQRAAELDAGLHAQRLRRHELALDDLPDGAFVLREGEAWLVRGRRLLRWTPAGYSDTTDRPPGERAVVLTPPSTVEVLGRGWRPAAVPFLHPSAR